VRLAWDEDMSAKEHPMNEEPVTLALPTEDRKTAYVFYRPSVFIPLAN
jgi:hypothetical protein